MCDNKKEVRWVKKGSDNQFVFENAIEILGMKEQYEALAKKEAEIKKEKERLTHPWKLSNGIEVRYSQEIGGDKNTTHEIFEWPSNEYLDGLTKE